MKEANLKSLPTRKDKITQRVKGWAVAKDWKWERAEGEQVKHRGLGQWNYSVGYCNCVYIILCICQNPLNSTALRANLDVCKFFNVEIWGEIENSRKECRIWEKIN